MSSYEEFKKNRKKNYSDESDYEKFKKNYRSTYSYDLGEDTIESFAKDYKALVGSYSEDSSNVGYKNASDLSSKYSTSASELRKRATQLSGYLNHNKDNLPEKDYNELKSYLDSAKMSLNGMEYDFKDKADYFSRFKTEKDYNDAVKAIEEDEKIKTFDTKAGQKEISELEGVLAEARKLTPNTPTSSHQKNRAIQGKQNTQEVNSYLKKYGYSSINELEAAISNKKAYLNRAAYIQKGIKRTNDALNAEDFDVYNIVNTDFAEDSTYKYINNIDGFRDSENQYWFEHDTYTTDQGLVMPTIKPSYIDSNIERMNDDEIGIFNYYYSKYGKEKAYEYLKGIQETLNTRSAREIHSQNDTNLERMLFAVAAGLDQFGSGMESLFNTEDDYITPSDTQIASGMIRKDLEDSGFKILGNSVGQIGYDIISNTSNMLPSILTSTVVGWINPVAGTAVGAGLMGASAAGNAYQEMLNLGYDKGQARTYSTLVGISEAGLSYALGGVSKLGGKLSGKAIGKLADKIDNVIGRVAINYGGKLASEFTEEYLQEVLTPVFKNIVLKTDEDVDWLSSEALYSGILGALSAGFLEGGSTVSAEVDFQRKAKMYSEPETVQELIDTALTLPEGSEAFNLAKEYQQKVDSGKSLKKAEILNLVEANQQGIISEDTSKMSSAAEARLTELGETGDVAQLSQIITKEVKGERLSLTENAILKNSRYAQRVINEMNPENIASGEYSSSWAESIGTEKINTEAYSGELSQPADVSAKGISAEPSRIASVPQDNAQEEKTIPEGKLFAELPKASESKLGVSESGQTVYAETNEPINIVEIASVEDGQVKLKTDSGEIVDAAEVKFGSRGEALVYEVTADMSVEVANDFIKGYNQLKAAPLVNRQSLESYLVGFKEAYGYGKYGIPYSSLERDGQYASSLSYGQRKIAYNRGSIDASNIAKSKQEALNKAKKKGKSLKGKIEYDEGIVGTLPDGEIRSESLKLLEFFNKNFAGAKIRIFASYVDENGKRVYKNRDGRVEAAPNGKYFQDGSLAIDLNAGNHGEGLILDAASHELTHRGKDFSPQKYKTYADLLFKYYGENNSVEELIQREIDFAKSKGRTLSEENAYHEAVARCSERMLVDCLNGTAQDFAKELYETDKSLWNKIKQFFADLVAKIKELYSQYPPESKAAQIVSEMQDVAEELQRAWLDMIVDSGQTQAAISDIVNIDAKGKSVSPMMSERTWTESEYVTHREESAKAISKALGVDLETAYKYIDDINGVARLIADDRARLDYDSNLDENATVLKSNKEYKYSVDMSTLCAKRLLFTGTFDAIQKALPNTAFDSDDIVGLRAMMQNRGYEVACGICYVESTRREIGRITQDFINSYKESQKTGNPITRVNSNGKVVELTKTKEQMETTAEKSTDKFYADKSYTPTLADLNTTDIDLVKKDHPLVYEAYLNFMNARGQAKPKLLETRAEYKGEILKHFKSKSAVTSRNNAGGLRLQSFSDFEVPHLIDMMQVIMDMSRVGLKSQAYTKVPAFAEVFGNTGVKINLSLIAKGSGLDSNGNLVFDDVEGINHEEAFKLRDKFSKNVGTILVGKTDAHIIAAMADPRIDYIIPFHKSFWKESLYEALGLTGYADYTEFQNEKSIDGSKIKNYDPSEYWDYSKTGDENAQIYLQKCRDEGRIPKFPQFQGYPGYWKLLIDFKMYDNDGVGSPQEVVQPTFETDAAEKILNEYKGGHRSFPIAKDVVDDFVKQYKESNKDAMYSDRDFSYSELVAKDDLQGVVIDKSRQVKLKPNGTIDIDWLMSKIKSDCSSVNTQAKFPTYYVSVPDIGRNVEITKDGVDHGIAPKNKPGKVSESALINARVSLDLPNILSNSIEVNRSRREGNLDVPYTHVMIGISAMENQDKTVDYYVVRMMVQERINQNPILVESNVLGKLYAVNAKKIDSSHAKVATNGSVARATKRLFGYSVADLLNDVKSVFGDTFSEDVYKHFGMKREASDFSENLLYSDRDSDGNTLSKEQIEFFKDSKVRDENGNLKVVYHGTPNGNFNTFRISDGTHSSLMAQYGAGYYFDANKDSAKRYTQNVNKTVGKHNPKVFEVYLNIKNPLVIHDEYLNGRKPVITKQQFKDVVSKGNYEWFFANGMPFELTKHLGKTKSEIQQLPREEIVKHWVDMTYDRAYFDSDILSAMVKAYKGDSILGVMKDVFGNDGVQVIDKYGEMWVAWDNSQIKDTTNTNPTSNPDIRYSDRDPDSISNRNLLANALESAVQNDIERNKLQQYKEKIDLIEAEQKKLSDLRNQIKEISFSKGKRDTVKLRKLQDEATRTANRITTYDRQLLNLEATTALKNVLNREKDMAKRRQKQKDAEILKAYKEKAAATQRKLLEKAQESREKAVEGRNKTAMRHKIQKVVSDLNQLLLNGSKDKHVMEGLQKAVATALNAINMDTVGAEERVAKYNTLIAKANDPDVIASLTETRDRIQAQGDKMSDKITALKNAYNDIINSSDPSLVNAYDSVITNYIEHVAEKVGNTSLRDMNLEQLEAIYDMYKMVLTTVRNFNKAFKMAKSESISSLGNRVMMEVEEVGGSKSHVVGGAIGAVLDFAKTQDFNNLKPVYAFERIGSNTLSNLYENVRQGEDVWAVNVTEAKEFKEKAAEKYGYKKWDFDAVYNFETSTGKKYSLTLEQIMSLYAYSKRDQALPHLAEGGFVFDRNIETYKENEKGKKSVLKYRVNTATAFKISETEVISIVGKLSKEQKGFVDEMQDYLSTVMGAKGNEVSLEMYGIKLFKEKFYFPLKSAKQYMYEQNEVAGEVKIKNSGFSKGTVKHANNPVILSNFMDVWSNHVNDMSMYHAFVLPLEDFNRVFNYNTPADKSLDEESVKGFIQNAYGEQANQYVSQLLKDLNGGARVDPRESIAKSMIGKFKKASVFGSLSVIIQQPSAVARALALVNAKYFDFNPKLINHNKLWSEVKKYAPVAIIKEMGHFDTDMGMSTVEYIKGEKTLMDKADDILSKPAAYMDELTWVHIWTAVKREVAAKNKGLKGEEYLQKCGERFTEVVTKTQVYDSVLSRSANMRSKGVFMNMLTSFMAEPTTAINMLEDAIVNLSRGKKGKAAGEVASVTASVILNSLLVSLVYAARDDDEDETMLEKYLGSFAAELVDGLNPITYFPILKDIWSIMQGYDVQRSDMTLIDKAVDSLKNVVSVMQIDTADMTEEELAEHNQKVLDAWLGIAGDLSSLVGIPAKNLIRDVKAGFNVYNTANRGQESSLSLIWNEVAESVKGTVPTVGWFSKESKSDNLYDVIMSGDAAYISRLKSGYTSEKAYNTAIRKALRENDPRIKEAAEARMNGDMTNYMQLALEIKSEGNFSQDNIVAAINAEITALKSGDSSESSKSVPTFTTSDYFNAAANGDSADVSAVKEYLVESGKTEQQIANSLNSKVKDAYEKGEIDSTKAISIMTEYGDKTLDEANISVKYIDFKADYPDYEDIVTEDKYKKYTEPMPNFNGRSLEDTGISVGAYAEYCEKSASCKGVDANGDGKADSGTKKAAVMQVINSLPISNYQKDALYYLNGWAAGTIYEAPWH